MQITGTSLAVSGGTSLGRQGHQKRQAGYIGQERKMEPSESIPQVLEGTKEPKSSHILMGGSRKLSVVPRPQASCPVLHAQLRKCGIDQLVVAGLLCHCPSNKSSGCMAARRESHMPATHIFHKNPCSWPPACQSLFYLPSWHPSPLSRCITGAGTRGSRVLDWLEEQEGRRRSSCSFRQ